MKWGAVALLASTVLGATASTMFAAEPNWAGEYADKKFLNGQAVFQLSIQQSGNSIQVAFDAAYVDGHGAAPEGDGQAKITGANTLEFTADGVTVSMNPRRVVDSRCLVFYGQNIRLKRTK